MKHLSIFVFLIFCSSTLVQVFAQGNNSSPKPNSYSYDNYDKYVQNKGYQPGLFNYYNPQDTFDSNRKVFTDPDELRKLGVGEESIGKLLKLRSAEDSMEMLRKHVNRLEEEKLKREFSRYGLIYNSSADTTISEYIDLIQMEKWKIIEKALRLPESTVYGQEFFRKNRLRMINQYNYTKVPEDYALQTGDEITVNVYGDSEYNENLVVDETGSIKTSVVGWIYVKGLTVSKAKQVIKSRLSTQYNLARSTVDVRVSSAATLSVNVVGEVFNPGSFRISSSNAAFNVLVETEGPNQNGSLRKIFVKRNGKTVKTLDVYKYLQDPSANMDYYVEDNDYIVVPPMGNVVNISGAIKRPTNYELIDNEGILDLLKYSGGFRTIAYKGHITLKRYGINDVRYITINVDSLKRSGKDFRLLNGDSLFVNTIKTNISKYVYVQGNGIASGGIVEYRNGDRVSDIVRRAGGLADRAFDAQAFIVRFNKDLSKRIVHVDLDQAMNQPFGTADLPIQDRDTLHILSQNAFRFNARVGIYGGVNYPKEFDYGDDITIKDLILLAGGLKKEAAENVIEVYRIIELDQQRDAKTQNRVKIFELQIPRNLNIPEGAANFKLQPYDQVYIRNKNFFTLQKNIVIGGEIVKPGDYPLTKNTQTLFDLINEAGGLTDYAYVKGIKVYRRKDGLTRQISLKLKNKDDLKKGRHNIVLSQGDSIVIPTYSQLITIRGEVNYAVDGRVEEIKVPYDGPQSALYYIKNYAGGFSREASRKRTAVVQPGGKAEYPSNTLGMKDYPIVENGAVITVPKKWKYANMDTYIYLKSQNKGGREWLSVVAPLATSLTTIITLLIATRK